MYRLLILATAATLLVGCGATVPKYEIWRPWNRSIGVLNTLTPGEAIEVKLEGKTDPLPGTDFSLADSMRTLVEHMLSRRGFRPGDSTAPAHLTIRFRTERQDRSTVEAFQTQRSLAGVEAGAITGSGRLAGMGVRVAQAVSAAIALSQTATSVSVQSRTFYSHSISMEMTSNGPHPAWTGKSTWDSPSPDILEDFNYVAQLLVAQFPTDTSYVPSVRAVRNDSYERYYMLHCVDDWYSCPALPFAIYFDITAEEYVTLVGGPATPQVLQGIADPWALDAYVDLIHTAEFALPTGSNDWSNPLDLNLWRKARLGGVYRIGNRPAPVNVVIDLEGESGGYHVKQCRTVSAEEFEQFQSEFRRWKQTLFDFFDMFE